MDGIRRPFQGVTNIIRFNWHFYLFSILAVVLLLLIDLFVKEKYVLLVCGLTVLLILLTLISLLVSFYVYDLSDLYKFNWSKNLSAPKNGKIVNIHAGFDETSALLKRRYSDSELIIFDFYDPKKHTEISIKRARKAYPDFPGTQKIHTNQLPLNSAFAEYIYFFLSAHEIRDDNERIQFFKESSRILTDSGKIVVVEHLRDWPNFLAYNIGCLHFLPKSSWHNTFEKSGLRISDKIKITPFITGYILEKNGASS